MFKRKMFKRKPFLILIILSFIVLAGAVLMDRRPVHFGFFDGDLGDEQVGIFDEDFGANDVLLVVDENEIAKAAESLSFDATDWSLGWKNLLEQEFGAVSIIGSSKLTAALEMPRRLVVLTRSCRGRGDLVGVLSDYVKDGGVLVSETPVASMARLAGLGTSSEGIEIDALNAEWVGKLDETLLSSFKKEMAPIRAFRTMMDPGAEVLLAANQIPLILERLLGRGRVISILMDVGRLIVENQQGRPSHDDYSMIETLGDYADIVEPDDLVGKLASLRENEIPHIDLIEKTIATLIAPSYQARVSRVPYGFNGIFVLTHDEDFRGGKECEALLACSEEFGALGSFLVIPHNRLSDLWLEGEDWYKNLRDRGAEIGFHLNRYQPMPVGIWKIEPLNVYYGTENQLDILRNHSPHVGEITSNRNHYLVWGDHYTRMFRVLAAHGITIDSTYGANKGRGYLFGTGSVFTPLDTNGYPIPILEVPFLNQETWGNADLEYFNRMLEANATQYHGTFVSLFHPHLDFVEPNVNGLDGKELLRKILAKARDSGHAFMTLKELNRFEDSRRKVRLVSTVSRDGLSIGVFGSSERLALEVLSPPGSVVEVNGRKIEPRAIDTPSGMGWVIELPRGESRVEIRR